MMMNDHQYQALLARSSGLPRVSSQLLPSQVDQYLLSRKLYGDRVAASDPYHPAVGSSLERSAIPYSVPNRGGAADNYPDSSLHLRAQLAAERRGGGLLPSPALVDYSPPPYGDHGGSRGVLPGPPISPEVVGGPYPGRFPSPQGAGQPLSNAELLAAARARRSEIAVGSYAGSGYGNELRRIPPASSAYDEPGVLPGPAAGILGPGGAGKGRDLDRYLLAVQPEKLVRYAASVLTPDPGLRRSGYPVAGDNLNPEDDRYSNYRRAKARRTGSHEFGGSVEPGSQRGTERDIYREREQFGERGRRGESGRERGRHSPDRRQMNGSLNKGNNDSSRVDRLKKDSQSLEGKRGQRDGGQSKSSRPSKNSEKQEKTRKPKGKVENDPKSDNDSELGSLCADLSDSGDEKVEKKSEEAATVIDGPLAGMIFGCSSATFHECMRLQLFGLPAKSKDDVMRVTPGTKVFLFNFDTKELSGIFEAVSHGGWQIQPEAFRDFGGFPAQVQVCCSEQCPNIPLSVFKPAIKENYVNQNRFKFDLNTKQVRDLVRMFRQAARNLPRQQDPLANRYLSAHLQSEDYLARGGGQQQRHYPLRHPQARFGTSRVVPYARVISSMSAKTTSIRKSKRASKRALKGRKKRKFLSNRPESPPMADNCSLYSLSGEIQEADDVAINASRCDDDTSNTNNTAVIVREGVETGNSRNVDQHKEIVETPPPAKGIAPSGPDNGLSPSKPPEEFPQLQNDLGKQVKSFLEDDSYNDGTFRLAGSRADEQGQGLGLDVLQGALSSGNVIIKSSDSTLSSMGEGLCPSEVRGDFSTTEPAVPLLTLGGNNVQQLASTTDDDGQLSELDEKRSLESLGDIVVPAHESSHADLDTCESISIECGFGGKLPYVHGNDVLTLEDEADCKLPISGKNEELELIAAEVAVGPEAPCVREDVMVAAGVVVKDEELEVIAAKVAIDSKAPFVIEEVVIASGVVGEDGEAEVIAAEVAMDCEALCVGEEVISVVKDEVTEVIVAEVAIDAEAPFVSEEVMTTAGAAGKYEELEMVAAEVAMYSETVSVREEVMIADGPVRKHEEVMIVGGADVKDEVTEGIAAEVAIDAEGPCVSEEVMTAAGAAGKYLELEMVAAEVAVYSETVSVTEEAVIADGPVGKHEELEVIVAEVAIDSEASCVREKRTIAAGVVGKDEELEVTTAEVALDSEVPFDRQEVVFAAGAVGKNEELEVIASEIAIDPEAPFDREGVVIAAWAIGKDEELEAIATDFDIDVEAPLDNEEVMIAAGAGVNDEELQVIAAELATDSQALCVREEVMIAARPLSSQFLASADMDYNVTVHDDVAQGEKVIFAVDAVDTEQPSQDLDVIHGDDEDEEEVLLTENAVDCELVTSADEDDDEGDDEVKEQDYDYDEGDGDEDEDEDENENEDEDEETVDVSVDGELSNLGEDGDEDEDVGEGVDDDGSWDGPDE